MAGPITNIRNNLLPLTRIEGPPPWEEGGSSASSLLAGTVTAPTVPGSVTLPSFDRSGGVNAPPQFGSPGFQAISPTEIEESGILGEVSSVISELLAGDLPEGVVDEIETEAAERSISTGILGQAGEFMTARDIGVSSLDLITTGIEAGTAVGQIETQRNTAEATLNAQIAQSNQQHAEAFASLQETARQWEDQMLQASIDNELDYRQQSLAAAALVSENQRFMQGLINDIIINNSRNEIAGAEDVISDLAAFMGVTDDGILQLMGISVR